MSKKIRLTEKQLRECILEDISQTLMLEEKDISAFAKRNVGDVIDYIKSKAKNANDSDEVTNLAREYGINLDLLQGKKTKDEYDTERQRKISDVTRNINPKTNSGKNDEITAWIKKYLPTLRDCCKHGKNFSRDYDSTLYDKNGELMRDKNGKVMMHTAGDTPLAFDKIEDPTVKYNVVLLKDFLDKVGLTTLYRDINPAKSVKTRANLNVQTPLKDVNIDDLNMDFGNISDDEAYSYYDSRKDKEPFSSIDLSAGYEKDPEYSGRVTNRVMFNNNPMVKALAKNGLMVQRAKRYVNITYGLSLDFGTDNGMFKFGNTKIHDDTLVVNFQSALRCPAWNKCIMKDACYAKTSEVNYDETLSSNLKKGFIWEQTRTDKRLMEIMVSLIRSCMIDYPKAAKQILAIKGSDKIDVSNFEKKVFSQAKKGEEFAKTLSYMSFAEVEKLYGPEAIKIMSQDNIKKGKLIRLNENGDFIGQWLVDAWEKIAKDFSKVGIYVAAYTCRGLNYTNVKNMILNISQANLVKGQDQKHFAHYFYAISPTEYDALGETYNGENYSLKIENDKIKPVFRNLIDESGELVGYYYKCPCGRGRNAYIEVTDPKKMTRKEREGATKITGSTMPTCFEGSDKFIFFNGKFYEKKKITGNGLKADCYMCRICYAREKLDGGVQVEGGGKQNPNLPVFVFVATHGMNKNEFEEDIADARKMLGKDVKYWINLQNNRTNEQSHESLKENINYDTGETDIDDNSGANSDLVIGQITKNITNSIATMMRNGGQKINEIKENFFKVLNKIKQ